MVLPRKVALEYDLSCTIRKDSISFSRKYDLTLKTEMKDHLFQKIHGNMIFSVYSVKMVFFFPANMILPFCQKSKDNLFPKNALKDDITGIIENT